MSSTSCGSPCARLRNIMIAVICTSSSGSSSSATRLPQPSSSIARRFKSEDAQYSRLRNALRECSRRGFSMLCVRPASVFTPPTSSTTCFIGEKSSTMLQMVAHACAWTEGQLSRSSLKRGVTMFASARLVRRALTLRDRLRVQTHAAVLTAGSSSSNAWTIGARPFASTSCFLESSLCWHRAPRHSITPSLCRGGALSSCM
mmetsp:Transcript_25108/g.70340  ORF Transcript_25108/g.70340 Transcript_25108/m.70340 type:complete len:202 (-) Transcript_25108:489-1094(-)